MRPAAWHWTKSQNHSGLQLDLSYNRRNIMNRRTSALSIVFAVSFASFGMAKDLYVAQNAQGSNTGADAADAYALAWLNTAGNWGTGSSNINPGDTVHLCGTFTTPLTISGSGTAGNPITIYFEPGANFTSPCWPSAGAIQLNGQSNITIDGGSNGLIQNTANGTGLGNHGQSSGVWGAAYLLVIRNLTITNIYNRIAGSADTGAYGNCINITSGSSIVISNCNVSDANGVISYSGPQSGDPVRSNIFILNNRIFNWNHGITVAVGDSSVGPQHAVLTNVVIAGNFLDHADKWDGLQPAFHLDGIILFNNTADPTVVINGLFIYQNTFGPNFVASNTISHGATAGIAEYLDGPVAQCQNTFIYNNVFQSYPSIGWANGFVNANGSNVWVFNNTCEVIGISGVPRGTDINVTGINAYCYNNILTPGAGITLNAIYGPTNTTIANNSANNLTVLKTYFKSVWSDYNVFQPDTNGVNNFGLLLCQNMAGGVVWQSGIFNSTEKWQTYIDDRFAWPMPIWNSTHCDPNSKTVRPTYISGTYIPTLTDIVAHNSGTNLTALGITTDFLGNSRPSTGNWDIGAYQAQADSQQSARPLPPSNLHVVSQ